MAHARNYLLEQDEDDAFLREKADDDCSLTRVNSKTRATVSTYKGIPVIHLGTMEIWDGADQALLRDMVKIKRTVLGEVFGVDLSYVKSLPPGTFGFFCDVADHAQEFILFSPTAEIRSFQWFKTYVSHPTIPDAFILDKTTVRGSSGRKS